MAKAIIKRRSAASTKPKPARKPVSEKKRDAAYALVQADLLKYQAEREANKPTITVPSEEFDEVERILVGLQEFFEEVRDDDDEAQTLRAASAHLFGEVTRALCKLDDLRAEADPEKAEAAKGVVHG